MMHTRPHRPRATLRGTVCEICEMRASWPGWSEPCSGIVPVTAEAQRKHRQREREQQAKEVGDGTE